MRRTRSRWMPAGNVWLNGTTASADFPNAQGWSQGSDFVAGLNAAGSALAYSSRLPDDTAAASLAVDGAGTLHFAGYGGLVSTLSPARQPWRRASSGLPIRRSARWAGASLAEK